MATSSRENSMWVKPAIALAIAAISATATLSVYVYKTKSKEFELRVKDLERALKFSIEKCVAERKGRIRAQQGGRKSLTQKSDKTRRVSYPMTPVAVIQSCFVSRFGTPRQPLLAPMVRACLVFDTSLAPPAALEGLSEYSHCWILYIFHLNTNMEKLWKHPGNPKIKAKVRVPKLKGGKMGVFATRSPHRPCPIGLTLAKVEAVQGHMVLLSGIDLVDGTPVLDIKPYLPYCESIQHAVVPNWVKEDNSLSVASVEFSPDFLPSLANCWVTAEDQSLYGSTEEIQTLIKQLLAWDIRSVSQRIRPHNVELRTGDENSSDLEEDGEVVVPCYAEGEVVYHLMVEDFDVVYKIDGEGHVIVERVTLCPKGQRRQNQCSYNMWQEMIGASAKLRE